MEELKKLFEEMQKAFADFRQANDERLKQIEAKGQADPLLVEKAEKANTAITALKAEIDELRAKANRPGLIGDEKAKKDAEEVKAFVAFLRSGAVEGLTFKAASVGSDGSGGYAVPDILDRTIGQMLLNDNPLRGICRVIRSPNENYTKLFDLRGATYGWVGETDARPATTTPTLTPITPVYGEFYANAFATQKLLDDAFFDVEAWLKASIGELYAVQENVAFLDGNGTNKPKGILQATFAETRDASRTFGQLEKFTSTTTASSFVDTDLIDLRARLKKGYRNNASWIMNALTVAHIRKFKDATSGQYLWQPGLAADEPDRLLGRPIVEDENMPDVGSSTMPVLFGDFMRGYTIVDVGTTVNIRDPYTNKPYIGFYFARRVGGMLEDSSAIKGLVCKSS